MRGGNNGSGGRALASPRSDGTPPRLPPANDPTGPGAAIAERAARGALCGGLTPAVDDGADDEAVDAKHTSHNDGQHVAHHKGRVHDTHGGQADARLGGSVSRAEVCGQGSKRGKGRQAPMFNAGRSCVGCPRAAQAQGPRLAQVRKESKEAARVARRPAPGARIAGGGGDLEGADLQPQGEGSVQCQRPPAARGDRSLANTMAPVTPMKPKKGADGGQASDMAISGKRGGVRSAAAGRGGSDLGLIRCRRSPPTLPGSKAEAEWSSGCTTPCFGWHARKLPSCVSRGTPGACGRRGRHGARASLPRGAVRPSKVDGAPHDGHRAPERGKAGPRLVQGSK